MTTMMEQMVIRLQLELFTLKTQAAARAQIAAAVQARLLTPAELEKDAPSLFDVHDLGRPTRFSGQEEDFQHWSKETEAFFVGVTKESEMMLEWSPEQTTEISAEFIDREFPPSGTKKPGVRFAADAYGAYGSHE